MNIAESDVTKMDYSTETHNMGELIMLTAQMPPNTYSSHDVSDISHLSSAHSCANYEIYDENDSQIAANYWQENVISVGGSKIPQIFTS